MKPYLERADAVRPAPRQLAWQELGFYGLVCFGMNTFTDSEWGSGGESPELFAPEKLRVRQWVRIAKASGMKGLILWVKHYDGFCMWHTKQTEHSVEHSPCSVDIVAEAAKYCAEEGIRFGVRIALWDRHDLRYGQGEAYERFFHAQLDELLTGYGDLFCVWLDNTCGEGKHGRQQSMDMQKICDKIRRLQPNAVIGGCGPDVRFSGNYVGFCRKAEWSVVPYYYAPTPPLPDDIKPPRRYMMTDLEPGGEKALRKGHRLIWYPAEVSMPMRKSWFYHEEEKYECKALSKLLDVWYASVGGNACLMLAMSPDKTGSICKQDMETLLSVGAPLGIDFGEDLAQESAMSCSGCLDGDTQPENVLDGSDETYWASSPDGGECWIEIDLLDDYDINKLVLGEAVAQQGQRVESYSVFGEVGGRWQKLGGGATIGYRSICDFPELRVQRMRVVFHKVRGFATLRLLEAY